MPPRDPSSCRGWIAFRVGPHYSRPSARRELLRQERDALSGAYLSPVRCNAVRSSEGAKAVSGHGGLVPAGPVCYRQAADRPAATLLPCARPNGSEGNGIGNARGIPPRGVGRRHLFGCQGVGPASRGRTALAASQSAPHLWRASSAGVSIRDIVPAGTASLSLRQADYLSRDRAEARARGEYSTGVLGCVKV